MSTTVKQSVIHVVSSLNVGGAERFVIDLCQQQAEQQMTPAILSFGAAEDTLVAVCNTLDIPVTVIRGKSLRAQQQRLAVLSRFNIIHIHSPAALKSLVLQLYLLRRKTLIYTRHGAAPLSTPQWKRIHKFARYFINCVTFVSAEAQQSFSHHGWHKVPQYIIDNGVRVPPLPTKTAAGNILRLGSVGRMISLKSQVSLLKAVAQLSAAQQQQLELHFYGDGELRSELEVFHQAHPAISAVFHGIEVNRENIYPHIDALVVTSSTEGLSMVILEAMAYARPVIATNVGGNPALVKPSVTGWLYQYDDIGELARLINMILNEPSLLHDIGLQARDWIAQHYSLAQTASRYQELYHAS
jgi:L-malate glycosyltransferase